MASESDPGSCSYWLNTDNGHVCTSRCSDDSIPLVGNFVGNESIVDIQIISEVQENALIGDKYDYVTADKIPLSTAEKRAILLEKKNERPMYELRDIYRNTPAMSLAEFIEKTRMYDNAFSSSVFLPLDLPVEFGYTGAFLANNAYQGTLHTFLRHHLQWQTLVPFVEVAISRLKPLAFYIEVVSNAKNMREAKKALSNFLEALRSLSPDDFNECQSALNEVQVEIVRHMQSKVTYSNYRGEGLNEKTQMEVYFRIQEGVISVNGYSKELFKAMHPISNYKPIRVLITIYFVDPEEQSKRMVVKTY